MYVFFKSPERDGSNKLGHTITIMTVDMYIHNFVNMYYIFTLFNWERKAEWYKKLYHNPESYVLNSAIITNLDEIGEDSSSNTNDLDVEDEMYVEYNGKTVGFFCDSFEVSGRGYVWLPFISMTVNEQSK